MITECKLPSNFDYRAYLMAFRLTYPVPEVNPLGLDGTLVYEANTALHKILTELSDTGKARRSNGNIWVVLASEKPKLAKTGLLPIAIHNGAKIAFVEGFPE